MATRVVAPTRRTRRNPTLIVAGVMLILAGVACAWQVTAGQVRTSVLVAVTPIAVGQQWESHHVRMVDVDDVPAGGAMRAPELDRLLGTRATSPLRAGDVIPDRLTPSAPVGDVRRVGIRLPAGRCPSSLRVGQQVRLIPLASEKEQVDDAVVAAVATASEHQPDGSTVFDADMPQASAAVFAGHVVAGRLVVTGATGK